MFELYRKGNDFYVKTIYNGKTLKFEEHCGGEEFCGIDDWFDYMGTRLVIDQKDLKAQCSKTPTSAQVANDKVPEWHWSQDILNNRPKKSELIDTKSMDTITLSVLKNAIVL